MFLLLSPFTFLFCSFYLCFILAIAFLSNFLQIWLFMELSTLIFMGISYSLFVVGSSALLFLFLIQSISSFSLLIFHELNSPILFSAFLLLNFGIFPFLSWYVNCLSVFPPLPMYLAFTFQNVSPLFLVLSSSSTLNWPLLLLSSLVTLAVGGSLMLTSQSLRYLLVFSSISANSWLIFGMYSSSTCLLIYLILYYSILFFLFLELSLTVDRVHYSSSTLFLLTLLSGLPPSPLFLGKLLVAISFISVIPVWVSLLFLVLSALSSAGYVLFCFYYLTTNLN